MNKSDQEKINALELLIDIYEVIQGDEEKKQFFKNDHTLRVYDHDLKRYGFEDTDKYSQFIVTCTALQGIDAGVLSVDSEERDNLYIEIAKYGKVISPLHTAIVTSSFFTDAKRCIYNLKHCRQIGPDQVQIRWNPVIFEISRSGHIKKFYRIKKGKGDIDKRREIMKTIFKHDKISVISLAKKVALSLEELKKEISKINQVIEDKLDVPGKRLIEHDDQWRNIHFNSSSFFLFN